MMGWNRLIEGGRPVSMWPPVSHPAPQVILSLNIIPWILLSIGADFAGAATITAYCHCRKCTPGSRITASGLRPLEGTTIAGPRWVPFGTRVAVSGVGTFIVQDRMPEKYQGGWDIYMKSHQRAKEFGKRDISVKILQTASRPKVR
jgi:3D (Asp-Asp-Asp) domain-containing protein